MPYSQINKTIKKRNKTNIAREPKNKKATTVSCYTVSQGMTDDNINEGKVVI